MSTATTAFVRGVIAASTAPGSRLSVCGSMSANTGVAPSSRKQFADATNENGDVIDGTERRDLRSGAAHEHLVREEEVGADQLRLLDRVAEVLGDLDHGVTCDPRKNRRRQRRREDVPVFDHEDVLPRAVRDVALRCE